MKALHDLSLKKTGISKKAKQKTKKTNKKRKEKKKTNFDVGKTKFIVSIRT